MKKYQGFDDLMKDVMDFLEQNPNHFFTLNRGKEVFVVLHSSAYDSMQEGLTNKEIPKGETIH